MRAVRRLSLGAALLLAACPKPSAPAPAHVACDLHCGTERWAVKTLTDSDAGRVDTVPHVATVAELRGLEVPPSVPRNNAGHPQLPATSRIAPVELTTYRVRAVIVGWKLETDEDYHLVIADSTDLGATMIAEVPSPTCPEICTTSAARLFAALRERIIGQLGQPRTSFHALEAPLPVTITGVGFFDFIHGQTGVAPNGIELHPVLAIEFR